MNKIAAILTKLQPHQRRALIKALKNDVILAHSTGSGKTLTSIAIADALGKPTTVLTPASLVGNFKKELAKHKKSGPKVNVLSLPTAVSMNYKIPAGNTVILDEAHSIRNEGTARQEYIKRQLVDAGRVIALTGTPAYNNLRDWAPLVNIVTRKQVIPSDFDKFFIKENVEYPSFIDRLLHDAKPSITYSLTNKEKLKKALEPYVDIFNKDIEKPRRIDQVIHVPMNIEQQAAYSMLTKGMPSNIVYKLKNNLPPSKSEASQLNSFLAGVRQVSNTAQPYTTNKIGPGEKLKTAVENLKDVFNKNKNARALVYSNYLEAGIDPYGELLDRAGIKYNKFNGSMSAKQKKEVVDSYNRGEVPVILGSGSASEGLDLKGTRLIQILEPHFNNAKIDQVIGRGIRYKSHSDLPVRDREVLVQKYISTLPDDSSWFTRSKPQVSVDQYLTARAKEKQELIDDARTLLEN